jgi:hypothetical protein
MRRSDTSVVATDNDWAGSVAAGPSAPARQVCVVTGTMRGRVATTPGIAGRWRNPGTGTRGLLGIAIIPRTGVDDGAGIGSGCAATEPTDA